MTGDCFLTAANSWKSRIMERKPNTSDATAGLRRRAEVRLRERRGNPRSGTAVPKSATDPRRLLHELQVHQVELEVQNLELLEARDRTEILLDKYTDLYDFAPVGYFSLDGQGAIMGVNLTGAALLGMERSRIIRQPLTRLMAPSSQPIFLAFLKRVFTDAGKQVCEAALLRKGVAPFWADLHGISGISADSPAKWCRVAVSDITAIKEAEQVQRRFEALAVANRELKQEVVRRQEVEESFRKSEQQQSRLLEQSRQMQEQLRQMSRQLLEAQEEERKKISRELHDVVAQTLTGINLRLANLKKAAALNTKGIERAIARTQQLVEHSVKIVHRFARELRPTVLDDLGLIPALHTFMKGFKEETGIHVALSAFAAIEQVKGDKRTVLYRVVQEALTNVSRHAHASRAEVKIQKLGDAVCMEIEDNGRGFRMEQMLRAKARRRLGLLGMRERVEMVGGTFAIESIPGKGTTVHAEIPFGGARGET